MSELEREYALDENSPVRGGFVVCDLVKRNKLAGEFLIKLSAITKISPISEQTPNVDECIFYTYKDCCYYAKIHPYELTKAINRCMFEPENHWEKYPD